MRWPFGELPPLSFDVIMADPAWSFDNWSEGGNGKNAKAGAVTVIVRGHKAPIENGTIKTILPKDAVLTHAHARRHERKVVAK